MVSGRLIMKFKLAVLCALGLASVNAMACYTVYDRNNQVVYNAQTPPVDMSLPISETVPARFPGGSMVFDLSTDCPREAAPRLVAAPPPAKPSPLLTDRRTAAAMKVPHTILPSGVALVNSPPPMNAVVTVVATSTPPPTLIAPAVVAHRSTSRDVVITEMHNPPLTVVQQGGMVVSELR
jgi:hypothetical protein